MTDDLNVLIRGYEDACSELKLAISESSSENTEAIRKCDKKLTEIFNNIVKLQPELEQRLTRIDFLSELLLKNYMNDDAFGFKLLSVVRADARQLHEIVQDNSTE